MIHCQCLAMDLRGHGDSRVENEDDLSADTLAKYIESETITRILNNSHLWGFPLLQRCSTNT